MTENIDIGKLVNGKEKFYFFIIAIMNLLFFGVIILLFTTAALNPQVAKILPVLIFYFIALSSIIIFSQGIFIGGIKNHGVKVTENQMPGVLKSAEKLSAQMGLKKIPEIYIIESGGLLNAFATKFFLGSKSFVVLYSDILDLAFNKGEGAIEFVIAHELAHIKRNHIDKRYLLMPMILFIPFINQAYYRACEYTCDKIATALVGQDAARQGLSVLCLGKKLFGNLNINDMIQSARDNGGFWTWLSEKLATHPAMYKRLEKVQG